MIVLIKDASQRLVFANVTHIEEKSKPSVFGGEPRKVINLFSGECILAGGDDIDLGQVEIIVLPNAEKEVLT